jgi:hypothetical protein
MKGMKRVSFKYYSNSQPHKIIMRIPNHSKLVKITAGGEGEEYRYQYSDSSLIYLSDLSSSITINEPLIRKQEGGYNKRFETDSIAFEGVNEKGNYWKEVKYKGAFYGYSNVPQVKKQFFDDAINSVKYQ